ncbi:MAG TPA: hypothetical protein VMS92_13025 [Mycobacterium sp.]|nr:hypothetical protein [Mycobacterium sp.]
MLTASTPFGVSGRSPDVGWRRFASSKELIGMLLTQPVPASTDPVRRETRVLAYQAFAE